jgi:hypothetical protein
MTVNRLIERNERDLERLRENVSVLKRRERSNSLASSSDKFAKY